MINSVKGTKDTFPDTIWRWQLIEAAFFRLASRYGFAEIRTPILESTELFARGVGDTTDVVSKQMYSFDDYSGRSITLRPEGTAGIARAFLQSKAYAQVQPTKYSYEIDCFRYEKPQSGRLREFHQFGVEVFGSADMLCDAEVIAFGAEFLASLGIKQLALKINSIGCPKCRVEYKEALQKFLRPRLDELCETCKTRFDKNPMRIIDCKSDICQDIVKDAPRMIDYLCEECETAFIDLKNYLNIMKIDYQVDPDIVRGLDYYTKTAFEFVSTSIGAQGTVCGGGRYDKLLGQIGEVDMPGVGFGMGIERLLLQLDAEGIDLEKAEPDKTIVIFIGQEAKTEAISLVADLRRAGEIALMDLNDRGMKAQFKYADKLGASRAIIIGEEELKSGVFQVRDMRTGEQAGKSRGDILGEISK